MILTQIYTQQVPFLSSVHMFCRQNYQELKRATQFLQHIVPWGHYGSLSTFNHRRHMINLKSIEKLLVEVIYLIFFVSKNEIACSLRKNVLVTITQNEEQQFKLIIATQQHKYHNEKINQNAFQKSFIEFSIIKESQSMAITLEFIEMILSIYNQCRAKGLIMMNQINQMIIKTELDEFCYIYEKLIKPKVKEIKCSEGLIRAFQQTRLFRENSILLKFTNNSLVSKIIISQACKKQIKQIAHDFEKERIRFLRFPQDYVKTIDKLIEAFFKKLLEHKKIEIRISTEQVQVEKQKQKLNIGTIVQSQIFDDHHIIFQIKVQQIRYEFLSTQRLQKIIQDPNAEVPFTIAQKQGHRRIHQFEIEYWSVRNEFQIKLFTRHVIKAQEIDIVGNIFNAYPHESIKYSLSKKKKYNQQQDLFLVLHTHSRLHPKENPFYSIIQQIDHLIIVFLLTEWDVKIKRVCSNNQKDLIRQKFEYLSQKLRDLMQEILQQ